VGAEKSMSDEHTWGLTRPRKRWLDLLYVGIGFSLIPMGKVSAAFGVALLSRIVYLNYEIWAERRALTAKAIKYSRIEQQSKYELVKQKQNSLYTDASATTLKSGSIWLSECNFEAVMSSVSIPVSKLNALNTKRMFMKEWKQLHPSKVAKGQLELLGELAFHSNKLDGGQLQLSDIIAFKRGIVNRTCRLSDVLMATGHRMLTDKLHKSAVTGEEKKVVITVNDLLMWHAMLTAGQEPAHPGVMRQALSDGKKEQAEIFEPAVVYPYPEELPTLAQKLVDWLNFNSKLSDEDKESRKHPIEVAVAVHWAISRLQLFKGGNAALARIVSNYVLMQNGWPVILFDHQQKSDYVYANEQMDEAKPDDMVRYFGEQLNASFLRLQTLVASQL
jgi:hypothetical protein